MTSMFGLVLAIGIVVDDAIVVVRRSAQDRSGDESSRSDRASDGGSVRACRCDCPLILAAVFIPVAFLGGISGQIYRQFALTIAASVLLSAFNALTLSPALGALILKPKRQAGGRVTWIIAALLADSRGRRIGIACSASRR